MTELTVGHGNYIAGRWRAAVEGGTYQRTNPAHPGVLIGDFPESTGADAALAVDAAHEASMLWHSKPAEARAQVLLRVADLLENGAHSIARRLTAEEGKPLAAAQGEVVRAAATFRYFAGLSLSPFGRRYPSARPNVILSSRREPLGVVLAITPFNFPLFVTALKLGPALTAGNAVVWKPSPYTPRTSISLISAFEEAGLPPGVLNVVMGTGSNLGRALVGSERVQAVSFTGSTSVGLEVGETTARRNVRAQLEMGGKNTLVVLEDADPAFAAKLACEGSFGESGQKCTATGLVVVSSVLADRFLREVATRCSVMKVGDGMDPNVAIGPLINQAAVDRVRGLISRSIDAGDKMIFAGDVPSHAAGHFIAPHVVRVTSTSSALAQEEIFGPVMPVMVADDAMKGALSLIEASQYGLSASIVTTNVAESSRFATLVPAGMVSVNLPTTGVDYSAPFGGWKLSGAAFAEGGPHALDFYTRSKTIAEGASPSIDQT